MLDPGNTMSKGFFELRPREHYELRVKKELKKKSPGCFENMTAHVRNTGL